MYPYSPVEMLAKSELIQKKSHQHLAASEDIGSLHPLKILTRRLFHLLLHSGLAHP
jgi:hypothetical protein